MASGARLDAKIDARGGCCPAFGAVRAALRFAFALCLCFAWPALPGSAANRAPEEAAAEARLARAIRHVAQPLTGAPTDYDRLLRRIGGARIVLLGEDTHGTHEFYVERARITRRLIAEEGFSGVVIEADWSEASGLRAYLAGAAHPASADAALRTFARFPRWMWANSDFRDLLHWLSEYNRRGGGAPVSVHGMDLYEIAPAAAGVIGYLEGISPAMAERARQRYLCLDSGSDAPQEGGAAPPRWPDIDCAAPVQDQLTELTTGAFLPDAAALDLADAGYVHALQSARVVRNAEEYFRAMRRQPDNSWDLRDTHMASSVDLLLAHLDARTGRRSRLVIWAHNAHIGDARATARGESGGLTLGQLLRERYPDDTFLVGFMTATGGVRAATDWGGPDRRRRLRAPIPGSHAALLHATGLRWFLLLPEDAPAVRAALDRLRPQRGVGVRYLPELELDGHYYSARLSGQFDAIIHIDKTTALRPLRRK